MSPQTLFRTRKEINTLYLYSYTHTHIYSFWVLFKHFLIKSSHAKKETLILSISHTRKQNQGLAANHTINSEARILTFAQKPMIFLLCHAMPLIGEGDGTPLQYSCLENPMDGGAW